MLAAAAGDRPRCRRRSAPSGGGGDEKDRAREGDRRGVRARGPGERKRRMTGVTAPAQGGAFPDGAPAGDGVLLRIDNLVKYYRSGSACSSSAKWPPCRRSMA